MLPNEKIRTRIAPSPTGPLHIGTARTALFNWLFARKYNGAFILRIEDTDLERSRKAYEKDIVEGLRWLGIEWDEGIEVGGDYAPYRQSERTATYAKYIEALLEKGLAFYCFHSENALKREKLAQIRAKMPQRHICDHFEKGPKNGPKIEKAIIRFRTPPGRKIVFEDLIRGKIEFDSSLLGDISIAKNLATPLYNLAVVIDDHEMAITHVIRGEDHISNTPKQILLQETLGFPQPHYGHLPLILGPDRAKLSKRHGALSLSWYREHGYLPEALVNFMALLGWNPGTNREIFSQKQLIQEFSLGKIQKGGSIFNIEKLDWINGAYIRNKSVEELTEFCIPYLIKGNLISIQDSRFKIQDSKETVNFEWLEKVVALEQERMKKLSEIGELTDFFFKDRLAYDKKMLKWKEMTDEEVTESLRRTEKILCDVSEGNWTKDYLSNLLMVGAGKMGDRGKLFWPFRVALTGKKASPDPIDIAMVLGKKKTLERLRRIKPI